MDTFALHVPYFTQWAGKIALDERVGDLEETDIHSSSSQPHNLFGITQSVWKLPTHKTIKCQVRQVIANMHNAKRSQFPWEDAIVITKKALWTSFFFWPFRLGPICFGDPASSHCHQLYSCSYWSRTFVLWHGALSCWQKPLQDVKLWL